jgi:ABC-type dipeptide/oligopeptide/nickel transport system permease component
MEQEQEDATININKNVMIGLVLLMLITVIFAVSAFTETDPIQEIENETIVNSSINDTDDQAADINDTTNRSAGPVSIPLEKPPFID